MSTNQEVEFNQAKKEAFAERMMSILNDAFLGVMISVGHRTRLFDTMADLPPLTSEKIASAAGLQERYVISKSDYRGCALFHCAKYHSESTHAH